MNLYNCFNRYAVTMVVATGIATTTFAQTKVLSDSQVQASVLRSLATASDLSNQSISVTTNSGVVTLSGSVRNDDQRNHADQLAATTAGVQRVIDQIAVGNETASSQGQGAGDPTQGKVLQSDGTYASATQGYDGSANGNQQQAQSEGSPQQASVDEVPPSNGPNTDAYGRPLSGTQAAPKGSADPGYSSARSNPGQLPPLHAYNAPYGQQGSPYNQPYSQNYGPGPGQPGGQTVTLPAGTLLRVRVNQHLSSRDVSVGTPFDAVVINDIAAGGQVAIPRGTFLQGAVVEAESAGHLKGRGELGLKLNQVTLGGRTYPISSDVFTAHGGDKTIQTVNSTVGLGALGAIFGAVAGGGVGAAIGAGAGGALGLGASAASGRGDVFIPSEAVLTFRLTQPAEVTTVSQAEMQRLATGVLAGEGRPQVVRRYPYPYYGPVVYPRYYYRPYGYYPY